MGGDQGSQGDLRDHPPVLGRLRIPHRRGGKMHERRLQEAAQQKTAFDQYVKEAAGTSGGDVASEFEQAG